MGYFYCKIISLILHAEILNPIRPLLRIQPNLTVSIFLDHPVGTLKTISKFKQQYSCTCKGQGVKKSRNFLLACHICGPWLCLYIIYLLPFLSSRKLEYAADKILFIIMFQDIYKDHIVLYIMFYFYYSDIQSTFPLNQAKKIRTEHFSLL